MSPGDQYRIKDAEFYGSQDQPDRHLYRCNTRPWRPAIRGCRASRPKRSGMRGLKHGRECGFRIELDMETSSAPEARLSAAEDHGAASLSA
jgi:hypothetical protein